MKKSFFRLPEDMTPQERSAFLIATLLAIPHFASVPYYLYLGWVSGSVQFYALAAISFALGALFVLGAVLSKRGRPTQATILVLGALAISYPPIALLVGGLGTVLGLALMVAGPLIASLVLSRRSGWVMAVATIISGLASFLLDVFGSATRLPLPGIFIQLLAVSVVGVLGGFLVRQLWTSGRIQNRIIVIFSAVLIPILVAFTWYNIQTQKQDLEKELVNKAETAAISGAATIGHLFEEAIANGDLTTEQVFDTNYVLYWEFNPATYEFDGNPPTLNKFHTAYDTYTDEKWQKLLDSYLNQEDFVFTIPVDKNGYLPTHNTRWSSWDGSPATDRSKRIFNDPVGIAAARNAQPTLVQVYPRPGTGETLMDVSAPIYVNGEHWGAFRVGALLVENNLFAQSSIQSATVRNLLASGLLVFGVVASSWFLGRYISSPLEKLTKSASQLSSGQFGEFVEIPDRVEITVLANTFNDMVAQLKNMIGTLEQRVAERTQNLELAADVGRSVSQVRNLDVMLKDACELIRSEFDLYYVQVYLTDASQMFLQLQAGTGEVGTQLLERKHRLQLNTGSINGRAAVEKRTVVISDTTESATFHPNPLLPDTRGEMAVPLIVGEKVVGVLDMQSTQPGVLNEETLPAFEALAGQLAVAIQNANLVAEAQEARAEVEKQARRLVRAGWDEHLDAIHKPEQLGFLFDHNEVTPLVETEESQFPAEGQTVSAPISLSGETLGSLVVEVEDENQSEQTGELVNLVARQVAQQIENLRLLESAERYRFEAERVLHSQTRESWREYAGTKTGESLGYLYDLNEVRPYSNGKDDASALTLSLKVRDEVIGKLSIQGLTPEDGESVDLANAVAERLSAHIENLRQYDQTQSALALSEKLFASSRSLTQATDLQELIAGVATTLNIPVVNRAVLATLDFSSTGEVEQFNIVANWWSGEGNPITPVGTTFGLETIKLMPMFVSEIPLFFNDAYNDERVDETTMKIVKQLNLQAVAVLPLHVGTEQVGVILLEAEEPYNFTEGEIRLLTGMGPQVATVMDNRRQYERAQKQAEREGMLNTISQKIQSATSVEAVLQIAARELGHALGAPMTVAQLSMKDRN